MDRLSAALTYNLHYPLPLARLTGVYAIIIGLHATLLKFAAGGPQAWLVEACVEKCVRGWWTNLLYINNYAQDIYSPGQLPGSYTFAGWPCSPPH